MNDRTQESSQHAHRRIVAAALLLAWCVVGGLLQMPVAHAAESAAGQPPKKIVVKQVQGRLTGKTARSISVEYALKGTVASEVLLPVGEDTQYERVDGLAALQTGDIVRVKYRETFTEGEDHQRAILGTVAAQVMLVRQAAASTNALRSDE